MDPFLKAFYEIDKSHSQVITEDELTNYMHKNKYKPKFVEKWIKMFKPDEQGRITLESFCDTLGLVHKENDRPTNIEKVQEIKQVIEKTIVKKIHYDMDENLQCSLIEIIEKVQNESDGMERQEIVEQIQYALNSKYGTQWHVFVGVGEFAMFCHNIAGSSFQFEIDGLFYLIWRTP